MTDAQGNQVTYRQIAARMTLKPWSGKEASAPDPVAGEPKAEQLEQPR